MEDVRDLLAGWAIGSGYYGTSVGVDDAAAMASALMSLFEPEVVTDVAGLNALPVGSVVLSTGGGAAWQKGYVGVWTGILGTRGARGIKERGYLPATVLHRGEA